MIQYFDWLPQLEAFSNVDSIENELAIFRYSEVIPDLLADMPFQVETMNNPQKFDFYIMGQHTSGSATIKIDMEEYELSEPLNIVKIVPGQIVEINKISPDFDAHIVLMSKRFLENLLVYINGSLPLR